MPSSASTTKITQDNLPAKYEIPIIPASELSYSRALKDFFLPNLPFIVTGLTNDWPARHAWVTVRKDSDAASKEVGGDSKAVTDLTLHETSHSSERTSKLPNWDYLEKEYGEFAVTVHFSAKEQESYDQGDTAEMKYKDVVKLWRNGQGSGLYVKDWHLKRQLRDRQISREKENKSSSLEDASTDSPIILSSEQMHNTSTQFTSLHLNKAVNASTDGESSSTKEKEGKKECKDESFYTTPDIFKDDWMDNYYTHNTEDDFSFVYFGSKGTFTPLHRDVCEFFLTVPSECSLSCFSSGYLSTLFRAAIQSRLHDLTDSLTFCFLLPRIVCALYTTCLRSSFQLFSFYRHQTRHIPGQQIF
jgi:hypothetical protein